MTKLSVIRFAVVATALISSLASCSPKQDAKTLVILGEDSSNLRAYSAIAGEFEKTSGVAVKFEGATFEQAVQRADADFRNGAGHYDIVLQYNFSLAPYVKNHYVASAEQIAQSGGNIKVADQSSLFPNAFAETSFYYSNPSNTGSKPAQFGVPFAANTMLLVYNSDLFQNPQLREKYRALSGEELTVPTDWPHYLKVAKFFASQPGLKGVAMQGAPDGWLYYETAQYLFGMGTGTSSKKFGWEEGSPITLVTETNENTLRYIKQLYATNSGDFYTVGASQQIDIMLRGNVAMALMWSDYIPLMLKANSPNKPHFGFAKVPGLKSGLAGGAFYINAKSKNIKEASQFVDYALSPAVQTKLLELGLISPLRSAYTEKVFKTVPYARALYESLDRGSFMFEAGTDADTFSTSLTANMQRYIRGEISEREALSQTEQAVLAARSSHK